MTNLPVEQVSESQRLASQVQVEPEAKVMQGHFRRQTCLKAIQSMRTLTSQPKGVKQLAIDGLNDLTQSSQPATPSFRPAHFTPLMGRTDDLCTIAVLPVLMQQITCKAFVGDIDALGRRSESCWRVANKVSASR